MKFELKNEIEYRTIDLDRAALDEDKRMIPASLSSEVAVPRSFGSEVLLHNDTSIDMSRAAKGLPLLFSHDTEQPIGRIENIRLDSGKLRGMLRFSKNARASEVWEDVKDGIMTDMSIGYRIEDYNETKDGIEATRWMPYEGSIVSVPADHQVGINRSKEEVTMTKETETPNSETQTGDSVVDFTVAQKRAIDKGRQDGINLERKRINDVTDVFQPFIEREGMSDLLTACIDAGKTADQARGIILANMGNNAEPLGGDFVQTGKRSDIQHGKTNMERMVEGMTEALLVRSGMGTDEQKANAHQSEFTGMTLSELAREWVRGKGINTAGMSKDKICSVAFKRDVTETAFTSVVADFPALLADVANKSLLRGYSEAPETWRGFCSVGSVTDFKTNSRPNMSMFPDLETVAENGAFPIKEVTDWAESITASTKGALFSITRQALINDDLNSFTKVPMLMGRAAARAVGDDAFSMLLAIQTMGEDTNPLFDAVNHNNVYAAGAPSVDTVDAIRVGMGTQTDPSGATLNLRPSVLVCGLGYEGVASTLRNAQFDPDTADASGNTSGNRPNWVAGTFEVIADARIDGDTNATNWFMLASPSMFDGIEVAFLNGVETPYLDQRDGFSIDGTEFKVRLDYGVAPLDWRTIALNGTAPI